MNLIGLVRHYLRALETHQGGPMQDELKRYLREEQKRREKAKHEQESAEDAIETLEAMQEYLKGREGAQQQAPRATAKPQQEKR